MEADIDNIFENGTNKEYESIYSSHLYQYIHISLQVIFCLIGIFFDAVIIFILYNSKQMRTRTNIIILNWAICDALYLFTSPSFVSVFLDREFITKHGGIFCTIESTDILFQLTSVLLILCLISNTIIKSKIIKDLIIVLVIYLSMFVIFIANTTLCFTHTYRYPLFYFISFFLMLGVLLFLISKEIHTCWRCIRKKSLSQNSLFRKNIGRIYLYGWTVSTIIYQMILPYGLEYVIIYALSYMSSMYITIYMAYADRNFKICVLNLLRFKWSHYDIDAVISFADDCSEYESDDESNPIPSS